MTVSIFVIKEAVQGLYKDKGSKFYAFAFPVHSLEEVGERLAAVKKAYFDARHHCYAYRLGDKGETFFSSDDREPANSAGPPILASLRSRQLTWVLVVVVRYFGGIQLGIRGLIDAYRQAADNALETAILEPIYAKRYFQVNFKYEDTSEVNRILHRFDVQTLEAEYTDVCRLSLSILEEEADRLFAMLSDVGLQVMEIPKIEDK